MSPYHIGTWTLNLVRPSFEPAQHLPRALVRSSVGARSAPAPLALGGFQTVHAVSAKRFMKDSGLMQCIMVLVWF